jgi:Rhs element Vgr protein
MKSLKSNIFSGGKLVSSNIISVDIIKQVNKIPYAQIMISEGSASDTTAVAMSNAKCFEPGKEIEIALSSDNSRKVFKGIVIKHSIKKTSENTILTVDVKDKSLKLALLRTNAVFVNKTDAQIIKDIADKKEIEVECSEKMYEHKQIVQYYCTDWDFIVSRAEANGLLIYPENGKLIIKKPVIEGSTTELTDILDFEIEADMSTQYKEVESVCWDIKKAELGRYKSNKTINLESKLEINNLSTAMGTGTRIAINGVNAEKEEMELWSNAELMKNRLSLLRGRVSIPGNPNIELGAAVTISEAGKIFSSKTIVTGIRHRIDKNGWVTDLQCGLSPKWFSQNNDIIEKPAAGLLPGINGMQVGIVEAFPSDGDPDKFHRIKVKIPAIDGKDNVIWARLLFPYAGDTRGMFFVPEEGDEVVIGFFNDDPRHAVVIGSLYNGQTETPLDFTDKNNQKGIVTRNGIKILFTDEDDKEKINIETPGGNKIILDDENGITVEDINENKATFNDDGISFQDKNKNKITTDDKGLTVEDLNKNSLAFDNKGIELKDMNSNSFAMSSSGIEIKDMNGNKVALSASGISVETSAQLALKGSAINLG